MPAVLWKTSGIFTAYHRVFMPAIDHPLIDQFLDALWLEKGLSDNSITD